MELSPTAGDDTTFLRITGRGADGVTTSLNTNEPFIGPLHFRISVMPDKEMEIVVLSSNVTATNDVTGRFATLHLKPTGLIGIHDLDDLSSSTPTVAGAVPLVVNTNYRMFITCNVTAGTMRVSIYNDTTDAHVETISGTGLNLDASVIAAIFLGWSQGPFSAVVTDPTATIVYGSCMVDNAAFKVSNYQLANRKPVANGTDTPGWDDTPTTIGGGALWEQVAVVPADVASQYLRSVTANDVYSCALQSCALAGITGTPDFFSPYYTGNDEGGAVTLSVGHREGSTIDDSSATDPGGVNNFHIRGKLYTSMPGDLGAITIERLDVCQTRVIHDNSTGALRVGSMGQIVGFVPTAGGLGVAAPRRKTRIIRNDGFQTTSGYGVRLGR